MYLSRQPAPRHTLIATAALMLFLSSCGGGGGDSGAGAGGGGSGSTGTSTPTQGSGQLALNSVELAQTHVVPPAGRTINTADGKSRTLTLIANRAALLMVEPATAGGNLRVEALSGNSSLGNIALNTPDKLPGTDNGMPIYSSGKHSVLLPKNWLQPGVTLRITRGNEVATVALTVTAELNLQVNTFPAFFFGANRALAATQKFEMDAALVADYAQEIPVASVRPVTLGDLAFNDFVLAPTGAQAAQVVANFADARAARGGDGYTLMGQILGVLSELRSVTANDDRNLNVAYWTPMVLRDPATGKLIGMGGGLTSVGAGNADGDSDNYGGIFVHDMGHGYGMSHAGDMYNNGTYPYPGGSLSGSSWGYDAIRNQLLSPAMPSLPCSATNRQKDGAGHCYRQDPMQGGSGDYQKTAGYRWSMFADYSSALIQGWMTSRIVFDPAAATAATRFVSWSAAQNTYVDASTSVSQSQLEMQGNQQIVTVFGNISKTDISLNRLVVSAIGQGNLPRTFDPTSQTDWDQMKAKSLNYCRTAGCDYTLRATFADGSMQAVLLPKGYHQANSSTINPNANDPNNAASFSRFAVNFTAGKILKRLDLYATEFGGKPDFTAISAASFGNAIVSWVAS